MESNLFCGKHQNCHPPSGCSECKLEEQITALRAALADAQAERDDARFELANMKDAWQRANGLLETLQQVLEKKSAAFQTVQAERDRALAFARKAGHLPICDKHPEAYDYQGRAIVNPICTCGLAELGVE